MAAPHRDLADWTARLPPGWRALVLLLRLDRPIGIWLLLLPGWWAIALAQDPPAPMLLALFALGAIVMRGAGCVINDICDRHLDAEVARTRLRPLASGMMRVETALLALACLLMLGAAILLALPAASWGWGLAVVPLIALYPLAKRVTWLAQAVLGLVFNWGVWLGFAAVGPVPWAVALPLYMAAVCWTIGYDTIYAMQDVADDTRLGLRSTARWFGRHVRLAVGLCYTLTVLLMLAAVLAAGWGWPALLLLIPAAHLWRQWQGWRPADPASSLEAFRRNRDTGLLVAAVLLLGQAW